jgi:hypothetical protein
MYSSDLDRRIPYAVLSEAWIVHLDTNSWRVSTGYSVVEVRYRKRPMQHLQFFPAPVYQPEHLG